MQKQIEKEKNANSNASPYHIWQYNGQFKTYSKGQPNFLKSESFHVFMVQEGKKNKQTDA